MSTKVSKSDQPHVPVLGDEIAKLGPNPLQATVDRLRAESALREKEVGRLKNDLSDLQQDYRTLADHKCDVERELAQVGSAQKIQKQLLDRSRLGADKLTAELASARTAAEQALAKGDEDKARLDWLLATGNICVVRQIKGCDTTWDKPTTRERIDWHINHPDESARKAALRPATEPHGEETKNL